MDEVVYIVRPLKKKLWRIKTAECQAELTLG